MNTDQAKSEIFAAIRQNLAVSLPFDRVHQAHQVHRQKIEDLIAENSFIENMPLVEIEGDGKNLTEKFRENLAAVSGKVLIVEDKEEAAAEIREIIKHLKADKIAVSDAPLVGEIVKSLDAKVEILQNAVAPDLFECDLGITGAQFGIAETGTLVIESDKEFNRLTSLIPPVHICVLETSKMHETLGEVLSELEKDLSRSITFITGQSRTSDIELTLALGVHGPGELVVILIKDI